MRTHLTVMAAALAFGCGGATRVKPDDMSAQQHRKEASRELALADQARREYDPHAVATREVTTRPRPPAYEIVEVPITYNPTAQHLEDARWHSKHAQAHERAAAKLEKFEEAECMAFAPSVRAACPVIGPVRAIVDIPHGVRFVLDPEVDASTVVAHMRCHFAHAQARGFDDLAACPLYVKGIDIRLGGDGGSVEVVAKDDATVAEIRRRSR